MSYLRLFRRLVRRLGLHFRIRDRGTILDPVRGRILILRIIQTEGNIYNRRWRFQNNVLYIDNDLIDPVNTTVEKIWTKFYQRQ